MSADKNKSTEVVVETDLEREMRTGLLESGEPMPAPKPKKLGLKTTDAKTEKELIDDGFQDEVWLHPASNNKGQGVVLQCRVPPIERRMVEKIVSRGRFPYETTSDLLRHALMNHLRFLNGFDGCPGKTTWGQVLVMKDQLAEEQQNITFIETFTGIERQVAELMAAGSRSRALTIIARHRQTILDMTDAYWRKRYLRELDIRFARYTYTPEE